MMSILSQIKCQGMLIGSQPKISINLEEITKFLFEKSIHSMLQEMQKLLAERDSIIERLEKTVEEEQNSKEQTFRELEEYRSQYIKTTVAHLEATGYVITNGIGDKGRRYLFFDVTELPADTAFSYHKGVEIVPVDAVADKVVPTEFTAEL